jgi:hypothetical protein
MKKGDYVTLSHYAQGVTGLEAHEPYEVAEVEHDTIFLKESPYFPLLKEDVTLAEPKQLDDYGCETQYATFLEWIGDVIDVRLTEVVEDIALARTPHERDERERAEKGLTDAYERVEIAIEAYNSNDEVTKDWISSC